MAYNYTTTTKDETVSFRTTEEVNEKLEKLANRIKAVEFRLGYGTSVAKAKSKSGLMHEILAGNLTFPEIEEKLQEVEDKDEGD